MPDSSIYCNAKVKLHLNFIQIWIDKIYNFASEVDDYMSFVNNSSSTGINFIGSTTESARIGKPAPTAPAPNSPIAAPVSDQVAQSAGAQGQAKPVNFLDESPQLLQFRQLLSSGKFDDLEALIGSMSVADLQKLQLSIQDIAKIAEGLGKGSLTAALPLVGSYTDSEQAAVKRLINSSSHLSVNQRIFLLKDNIGPGAVLEFVQKARPEELKQLSSANRHMALSVLDPGSSIWGTVSGAATEAITRRYQGQKRPEDQLAGQILHSAKNETELRALLAQLNQFSRDDAVYHYVTSLSPKELNGLSDEMKKELLQHLVDTGIQLPLIHIDLNSIANLDETLKMTFSDHVGAARLLYQALTPKAQQSAEVQQIVAKSDELVKELSQLQAAIEKDKQASTLTQAKIDAYRVQAQALKQKLAGNPELQQKAQALLDTLTNLQKDLRTAASNQVAVVQDFSQTRGSIQRAQGAVTKAQKALTELKTALPQAQARLQAQETKMLALYQGLLQTRQKFSAMEPRYTQLLQEMEAALQNPRTQKGKLGQLESLNQQLKQIESQLGTQNQESQAIMTEVNALSESLEQGKQTYNREADALNQERKALQDNQAKLKGSLSTYTTQVAKLETGLAQAKKQMQELKAAGAPDSVSADLQKEISQLEKEISTHRSTLQGIQKDYTQYLVPEAEKIEVAAAQQATEREALEPALQEAENSAEASGGVFQVFVDAFDYLKDKVSQVVAQTKSFVGDWSSRLSQGGTISTADIQAFRSGFTSKMQDLETQLQEAQKTGAPEALRQELETQIATLKSLSTTVDQLEKSIQKTDALTETAQKTLGQLETQKAELESELKAANEVIELSSLSISTYERKIAEIQAKIDVLQSDLGQYGSQIAEVLANIDKSRSDAKKMQELYGKGQMGSTELSQFLKGNQTHQADLQARLNQLYQEVDRVSGQIENQAETLTTQTRSLAEEKRKTDLAVKQAEAVRTSLQAVQAQNKAVIAQVQQELQNLPAQAQDFPPVKEKLAQIDTFVKKLDSSNQAAEGLIQQINQTVLSTLPYNQKVKDTHAALETLSSRTRGLQSQELVNVLTSLDAANRKTVEIEEKARLAQAEVRAFEALLNNREQPLKIEEARAEVRRLMQQEDLRGPESEFLKKIDDEFLAQSQSRAEKEAALSIHEGKRTSNGQTYAAAQAANELTRTQLAELQSTISDAETELDTGKKEMLGLQKQLLDMRKSLGLDSAEYRACLERYEALIKDGKPLSPAQAAELDALEQKLSRLESFNANSNGLKERLTGLNTLKARINQQIETLKQKTERLTEMRDRLIASNADLRLSRDQLVTNKVQLEQDRAKLVTLLAELEAKLKVGPVSAELLEMRNKLRAELQKTDQLLQKYTAELAKTDADLSNGGLLIAQIDLTLEQARTIQEKLAMLVFKMDDLIRQGEDLLADYQQFEKDIQTLKSELNESKKVLETELAPTPRSAAPASVAPESGKESKSSPFNAMQKFLGDGLSGLMRQRQDLDSERDQAYQAKREKMLKALEQQVSESRQLDHAWKAKIQDQAELEKITDQMIQSAYNGQTNVSGINIVGLIGKQALESAEQV